jgi:hypothetical protein
VPGVKDVTVSRPDSLSIVSLTVGCWRWKDVDVRLLVRRLLFLRTPGATTLKSGAFAFGP